MSGSRPTPAEQHLGDRLAALIDGELDHDARERVLAHLATCTKCKAEADAQRRLKKAFAQAAPPPPTESFLARLQGLPAGGDDTPRDGFAGGVFPLHPEPFAYAPTQGHGVLPPADRGFRIHPMGRAEAERAAPLGGRGRRFAFAAAGAVSLAAIALGGVSASSAGTGGAGGGEVRGSGSNATPQRTQGTGAGASADTSRRRATEVVAQEGRGHRQEYQNGHTSAAPAEVLGAGQALTPLLAVGVRPPAPEPAAAASRRPLSPLLAGITADPHPFLRSANAPRAALLAPLLAAPSESATALTEPSPSSSPTSSPLR
ncbi:zf-HC2 domain-containing protein [Streptomyces physcomitrii]|uniref:anti-sigma factor family protein n=1 Tax=Streptomyces physcomitrii TaxID=2724184 RepID=UPI0033C32A8D